ncbi:hypothetical protein niasHT_023957 [Heterodera trifolii]|uniref:Uncharacterized protein n=1 Tax=Heterodera trifolii TaxID=157864 RepID=A0ABD2JW49_9BILA
MVPKIGRIFTGLLALSSVAQPGTANASQMGGAVQAVYQQQWTPPIQMPGQNLMQTPVSMKNREISLGVKKSSETTVYGESKHHVPNGPNPIQNGRKGGHF